MPHKANTDVEGHLLDKESGSAECLTSLKWNGNFILGYICLTSKSFNIDTYMYNFPNPGEIKQLVETTTQIRRLQICIHKKNLKNIKRIDVLISDICSTTVKVYIISTELFIR